MTSNSALNLANGAMQSTLSLADKDVEERDTEQVKDGQFSAMMKLYKSASRENRGMKRATQDKAPARSSSLDASGLTVVDAAGARSFGISGKKGTRKIAVVLNRLLFGQHTEERKVELDLVEDEQDRLVREKLAQQLSHAARHKAKPMTEIFRDKFPAKTAVSETGKGSGVTAEADEYNIDQVPFYDREEAELVYNLCVKAIMLHSVLQEEETEKGVPDKEATQRLLGQLSAAFRVEQRVLRDLLDLYEDKNNRKEQLRAELRFHLRALQQHAYYSRQAFPNPKAYEEWLALERRSLEKHLLVLDQKKQASKRQVKPAKAAEARKRDAGAAGAGVNGGPAVKKPWWACGCMSSSDAESPKAAAAANMAPAPELPPAAGDTDRSDRKNGSDEKALDNSDANVRANPADYVSPLQLLLWILIQHDAWANSDGPLIATKRQALSQVACTLTPDSQRILEHYCDVFRIGPVRRQLDYLQVLCNNQAALEEYFLNLSETVAQLEALRQRKPGPNGAVALPWTQAEQRAYGDLLVEAFTWTVECISHYQSVFKTTRAALGACADAMSDMWHPLCDLGMRGQRPDDTLQKVVTTAVQEAITRSYRELIIASRQILEDHAKQAAAEAKAEQEKKIAAVAAVAGKASQSKKEVLVTNAADALIDETRMPSELTASAEVDQLNINSSASVDLLREARDQDINVLGQITNLQQLVQVFKAAEQELEEAEEDETQLEFEFEFSLTRIVAETMLALVWSDAQMYLRTRGRIEELIWDYLEMQKGKGKTAKQIKSVIPKVFQLYPVMERFYARVAKTLKDLPAYPLQSWFEPFVTIWLSQREDKFNEQYIESIIKSDTFQPLNPQGKLFYSTSVIELFSLLSPISRTFLQLPYTRDHLKQFVGVMTGAMSRYAHRVYGLICEELDREDEEHPLTWGMKIPSEGKDKGRLVVSISPQLIVRCNDVRIVLDKLIEMLREIDVSTSYDTAIDLHRTASEIKREEAFLAEKVDEDDLKVFVMKELGVSDSVSHIRALIKQLCRRIARGYSSFAIKILDACITEKPVTEIWDDLTTQDFLQPMFSYLIDSLDHLTDLAGGPDDVPDLLDELFFELCSDLLEILCKHLEHLLTTPKKDKWKNNLRKQQYHRVKHAYELLVDFFREEYQLPDIFFQRLSAKHQVLDRIKYLLALLQREDSSKELSALWKNRPAKDDAGASQELSPEAREAERVKAPPYLLGDQIFGIMKFRKEEENDPVATDFVKTNSKGFFSKWF